LSCCGRTAHTIELRGGSAPLCLVRCGGCGQREYRVEGVPVEPEEALAQLGATYRALPREARAARDRVVTAGAARRAAQAAAAAAAPVVAAPAPAGVDRDDLARLLQGWTVLGATG
jgi:hypothetical protein